MKVEPAHTPPIRIRVSDVPEKRLTQMDGFFRRNPGYIKTGGIGDALLSVLERSGGKPGREFVRVYEPTELGYGQLIHDQMQWQISSKRQPDNEWWMRMNRQLVSDPLTAEAAVRAGREADLTAPGQKAWAKFVHASDRVREALGVPVDAVHLLAKDGERLPIAVSDAWKGASALTRIKVAFVLRPQARQALWDAHKASLDEGRTLARAEGVSVNAKWPKEAEFGSGWASTIGWWAMLNPHAVGRIALPVQEHLLPPTHPIEPDQLPPLKRAFFKLLSWADPEYEKAHRPAHAAHD